MALPFQRIDTITLRQALPRVFERERVPASDVWLCEATIRRAGDTLIEAASGTGKSSLCAYLMGLRQDYVGTILFNGTDIRSFSLNDWQLLRRHHLAYLPQELALFPELTAWQNIELKNDLTRHADSARIMRWMERLGVDFRKDAPVGKLSIGQQQRVAIIRSICQPFDFLLVDEPVSHLDAENNRIASQLIAEEARRQNAAILATSVGNRIDLTFEQELLLRK